MVELYDRFQLIEYYKMDRAMYQQVGSTCIQGL